MSSLPHVTVATVVADRGRFLMVKEEADGEVVYNQPAGHVENGESVILAAQRETLEETRWQVEIEHFLGIYEYTSPHNGISYIRLAFCAKAVREQTDASLDAGILDAAWFTLAEIRALDNRLRSPIVVRCIEDYLNGQQFPLSVISPR